MNRVGAIVHLFFYRFLAFREFEHRIPLQTQPRFAKLHRRCLTRILALRHPQFLKLAFFFKATAHHDGDVAIYG